MSEQTETNTARQRAEALLEESNGFTHDEKELIIECIETDLKAKEDRPGDNLMYKEWYKLRKKHLKSLIVRIREHL